MISSFDGYFFAEIPTDLVNLKVLNTNLKFGSVFFGTIKQIALQNTMIGPLGVFHETSKFLHIWKTVGSCLRKMKVSNEIKNYSRRDYKVKLKYFRICFDQDNTVTSRISCIGLTFSAARWCASGLCVAQLGRVQGHPWWCRSLSLFPVEVKDLFMLHCQYHGIP